MDGTVRRVSTTYEIRGLREKITSYDNATVGSGTALNELVYEYNDLGQATKEYQEHEGVQDGSTLYVGYNYDTTVSASEYTKGLRPTSVRYPNARLVHRTYGSSGSPADALGRVEVDQGRQWRFARHFVLRLFLSGRRHRSSWKTMRSPT